MEVSDEAIYGPTRCTNSGLLPRVLARHRVRIASHARLCAKRHHGIHSIRDFTSPCLASLTKLSASPDSQLTPKMAPIRRYLRISKFSVLECRIYLDNPGLAQTWLLNPRDPVLPRVIESIRPLVLPKLREEKERSRKKNNKRKEIKDVVATGRACLFPTIERLLLRLRIKGMRIDADGCR